MSDFWSSNKENVPPQCTSEDFDISDYFIDGWGALGSINYGSVGVEMFENRPGANKTGGSAAGVEMIGNTYQTGGCGGNGVEMFENRPGANKTGGSAAGVEMIGNTYQTGGCGGNGVEMFENRPGANKTGGSAAGVEMIGNTYQMGGCGGTGVEMFGNRNGALGSINYGGVGAETTRNRAGAIDTETTGNHQIVESQHHMDYVLRIDIGKKLLAGELTDLFGTFTETVRADLEKKGVFKGRRRRGSVKAKIEWLLGENVATHGRKYSEVYNANFRKAKK